MLDKSTSFHPTGTFLKSTHASMCEEIATKVLQGDGDRRVATQVPIAAFYASHTPSDCCIKYVKTGEWTLTTVQRRIVSVPQTLLNPYRL